MTIVVGYLWVAAPKEATVRDDGTISWAGARRVIGDSERVAIEFARGLAETTGKRLVGVTVGDALTATSQAASAGLACGIDEVVVVKLPEPPETAGAAAAMAAVISGLGDVRLVVLGNGASDSGGRLFGPSLAGLLECPGLSDVTDAGFDGDALWAVSEAHGAPRQYRISGRAVLNVSGASRTPRQMGLRDIMAASSKPSRIVTPEDLDATPMGRVGLLGRAALATGTRKGRVIAGVEVDTAAAQVVAELVARGVL